MNALPPCFWVLCGLMTTNNDDDDVRGDRRPISFEAREISWWGEGGRSTSNKTRFVQKFSRKKNRSYQSAVAGPRTKATHKSIISLCNGGRTIDRTWTRRTGKRKGERGEKQIASTTTQLPKELGCLKDMMLTKILRLS